MKKTFYITTPIYYPSGDLHLGHFYSTTIAWVIKNYKQLVGYDVKFLVGSDEHGQKIQQSALKNGLDPQTYVDQQVLKFKHLWNKAHIDYSFFWRTTNKQHVVAVQKVFAQMLERGHIYKGKYKGLYSISDEEFLTPTQAIKQGDKYYHPVSNNELIYVEEDSYFFKISAFESWIKQYYFDYPNFVINKKTQNELINNFIDKGLEDLSITRNSFDWGIKVLGDEKNVIYVWLDALFNYTTALGYQTEDSEFQKFWQNGDEVVHVVGKEITRFHLIYWPIMLKSLDLRIPNTVLSHGWLITEEGKMSKSKGNVINPLELLDKYHYESLKYFFVSQIHFENDSVFSEKLFINVYNAELSNNYGNLFSRVLTMSEQNFPHGTIYKPEELTAIDKSIFTKLNELKDVYQQSMNEFKLSFAFKKVLEFSSSLNLYIDETKPWTLTNDLKRLNVVINTLLNGIYAIATFLSPVLVDKTQEIFDQLQVAGPNIHIVSDFTKFDNIVTNKKGIWFERIKTNN